MNRQIFWPSEGVVNTDFEKMQKDIMLSQGHFMQALLGSSSAFFSGLEATPVIPAALQVSVSSGSCFQLEQTDPTAHGSVAPDPTLLMKQAISLLPQIFTVVPPTQTGYEVKYLIQSIFEQKDSPPESRNFRNPGTPTGLPPIVQQVSTQRLCLLTLSTKMGVPALAGAAVIPDPDAGHIGLWEITVANGQTTLTNANIKRHAPTVFLQTLGNKYYLFANAQGGGYPPNTLQTVTWSIQELIDSQGCLDETYRFYRVKESGYYSVDAAFAFQAAVKSIVVSRCSYILNDIEMRRTQTVDGTGDNGGSIIMSDTRYLSIGDRISLALYHDDISDRTLGGTAVNTLIVRKV